MGELQRAKFSLIHWPYYEKNIQELDYYPKISAVSFFRSLKQLEQEEVKLLAARYYKSKNPANYNERIGKYTTVIPVPFKEIADSMGLSQNAVQNELKRIEKKLWSIIVEQRKQVEYEVSKERLEVLEKQTLEKLEDDQERAILSKAFRQIALQRREGSR